MLKTLDFASILELRISIKALSMYRNFISKNIKYESLNDLIKSINKESDLLDFLQETIKDKYFFEFKAMYADNMIDMFENLLKIKDAFNVSYCMEDCDIYDEIVNFDKYYMEIPKDLIECSDGVAFKKPSELLRSYKDLSNNAEYVYEILNRNLRVYDISDEDDLIYNLKSGLIEWCKWEIVDENMLAYYKKNKHDDDKISILYYAIKKYIQSQHAEYISIGISYKEDKITVLEVLRCFEDYNGNLIKSQEEILQERIMDFMKFVMVYVNFIIPGR